MTGEDASSMDRLPESVQHQLSVLRGGLVVSCQAHGGSVLANAPEAMALIAQAAVQGGAAGIRADGPVDIRAIRARIAAPIIGIRKVPFTGGPFITPTCDDARAVVEAGAPLVALEATRRPRPGGQTLEQVIGCIHTLGGAALADVATLDGGLAAVRSGADLVGTTMSGYTSDSPHQLEPDFELLKALVAECGVPVFAEGRIATPEQARDALRLGAAFVVVGTVITDPMALSARFVHGLH
jgi:putative N-acetylmannosamine-6-phosphate epimerase